MSYPILLTYRIPKNQATSAATQLAKFSSLVLDQGELQLLLLQVTSDVTTDAGPYLERKLTLSEKVPDFANAFGGSEDPTAWNLKTLWGTTIEKALQTSLLPVP